MLSKNELKFLRKTGIFAAIITIGSFGFWLSFSTICLGYSGGPQNGIDIGENARAINRMNLQVGTGSVFVTRYGTTTVTGSSSVGFMSGTDTAYPRSVWTPSTGKLNFLNIALQQDGSDFVTNLTGDVTSVGNATTLTNAPVIAKVLTGYTSGAGTITSSDSILSAIQKLNGNDATNANLTGVITSSGNATSIAAQTGTGSTFVVQASPTITTPTIASMIGNKIYPSADSTTAVQILKANGTTAVVTVDTTNGRLGLNKTPADFTYEFEGALYNTATYPINLVLYDSAALAADIGGGIGFGGIWSGSAKTPWASINGGKTNATDGSLQGYLRLSTRTSGTDLVERMRITDVGNVALGTTTPSTQFHTTGGVRFATLGAGAVQSDASGNLSVSSDERLKDIQGSFTPGLAGIMGINPIMYRYNKLSGLDTENLYAGFSAQNVLENIPEATSIDSRGYLGIQDRTILAVVVNAIKELQAEIDMLKQVNNIPLVEYKAATVSSLDKCVKTKQITIEETPCLVGEETHEYVEEGKEAKLVYQLKDGFRFDKDKGIFFRRETVLEAEARRAKTIGALIKLN